MRFPDKIPLLDWKIWIGEQRLMDEVKDVRFLPEDDTELISHAIIKSSDHAAIYTARGDYMILKKVEICNSGSWERYLELRGEALSKQAGLFLTKTALVRDDTA